ncbi:MAG: glycosyltransferase family 4 protein [Magnetospirillum sp.]|nr:glycosyltransferase family 4 protein [Magnetospirillum sp.]
MRLVFLSHQGDTGGATAAMVEGIEALTARGHRAEVWMPAPGTLIPKLEALGVAYRIVPLPAWASTKGRKAWRLRWRTWRATAPLAAALRAAKPDAVVTNTMVLGVGALAAEAAGIPHVWWIHEFGREDHGLEFAWGDARTAAIMTRTTRLAIVNSDAVGAKYADFLPRERIVRVYYRIDPAPAMAQAPPFAPADAFHLALPGSLNPQKGQDVAIEALIALARAGKRPHLHFFGEGAEGYAARLRARAAEGGIADTVRFHGHVGDLGARLARASAVLVPSRCEAFGRVTVEAMRAGSAVIASDQGGTRELIRDGDTGLLFPAGDAPALAARIARLMDDPGFAARLGEAGARWAGPRFTAREFAAALEAALVRAVQSATGVSG